MSYRIPEPSGARARIVYRTGGVQLAHVVAGLLALVVGAGVPLFTVVSRVRCVRRPGEEPMCAAMRYAVEGFRGETFGPGEWTLAANGLPDATFGVKLTMEGTERGGHYRGFVLATGTGREKFVGRKAAAEAQQALARFFADPAEPELDIWFRPGLGWLGFCFFAVGVGLTLGVRTLRDERERTRKIVIVADRERVSFDRCVLATAEIEDVEVELGAMASAATESGSSAGHRLVFVTRDGRRIPVSREHRGGSRGVHEEIRARVLTAMGRSR